MDVDVCGADWLWRCDANSRVLRRPTRCVRRREPRPPRRRPVGGPRRPGPSEAQQAQTREEQAHQAHSYFADNRQVEPLRTWVSAPLQRAASRALQLATLHTRIVAGSNILEFARRSCIITMLQRCATQSFRVAVQHSISGAAASAARRRRACLSRPTTEDTLRTGSRRCTGASQLCNLRVCELASLQPQLWQPAPGEPSKGSACAQRVSSTAPAKARCLSALINRAAQMGDTIGRDLNTSAQWR